LLRVDDRKYQYQSKYQFYLLAVNCKLALIGALWLALLLGIINICVCYNTVKHQQSILLQTFVLMIRLVSLGCHLKESNDHKFYMFVHTITEAGDPQKYGGLIIDMF
jgi:hypothetical protein